MEWKIFKEILNVRYTKTQRNGDRIGETER